ncbi:hypothetical protein LINGRAHAP2_LOCUS27860 [Linum grandiflorum]
MTSRNIKLNGMQDRLATHRRPGYGMAVEVLGDKHYLFRFNHGHDLRWEELKRRRVDSTSDLVIREQADNNGSRRE